jgi:hypothetical protein
MNSAARSEAFPTISIDTAPGSAKMEIVFIDGKAPNYRQLINAARPGIELHVLDGSSDGLAEMGQVLAGRSNITAIHIVGHGNAGLLQLGSTTLTSANLDAHAASLSAIGAALAPGGDILLYGCNVAQGEDGQGFIQKLSAVMGADVAASDDLTGGSAVGGDWDLERTTGSIEAATFGTPAELDTYSSVLAAIHYDFFGGTIVDAGRRSDGMSSDVQFSRDGFTAKFDSDASAAYLDASRFLTVDTGAAQLKISFSQNQTFTPASLWIANQDPNLAYRFTMTSSKGGTASLDLGSHNSGAYYGTLAAPAGEQWSDVDYVTLTWASTAYPYTNRLTSPALFHDFQVTRVNSAPVNTVPGWHTIATNGVPLHLNTDAGLSVADADGQTMTVTLSLADSSRGTLSVDAGDYTLSGSGSPALSIVGTTAQVNAALATALYLPSADASAYGFGFGNLVMTTSDGIATDIDTVRIDVDRRTSHAPTNIALSSSTVNQSAGSNAAVGTLSSTDVDDTSGFTYALVSGDGTNDTGNAAFNISGDTLRANDAGSLAAGIYNLYLRTTDSHGAAYSKAFAVTVADNVAPTVNSVSAPAGGTYRVSQSLEFTVNFSEAITVDTAGGTPSLALSLNTGGTVNAAYASGSGAQNLVFRYYVAQGNKDLDGVTVGALATNGGTLRDAAGNNASLALNSVGSTTAVLVDAAEPGVMSIVRAGASSLTNAAGMDYTVTFSESVTGVDISDFVLTATGSASGHLASVTGSGNTYTVTGNNVSGDGTLRLDLKATGTGIANTLGTMIGTGFTSGQAYTIDHTAPLITGITIPNAPMNVGNSVSATITVAADADSYTLASGAIGGFALTNLVRVSATQYSAQFTVANGGFDVAASADIPLSLVLGDSAGNQSVAYTTPISQTNDSIAAHLPIVTVVPTAPASDPAPTAPATTPGTTTIDGVSVQTSIVPSVDGAPPAAVIDIAPVNNSTRQEDTSTRNATLADIPLMFGDNAHQNALTAISLPDGIGLRAQGSAQALSSADALKQLIPLITHTSEARQDGDKGKLVEGGQAFLAELVKSGNDAVLVHELTLKAADATAPGEAITISGSAASGVVEALVIDASQLPHGTVLQLQNVEFAVIVGPAIVTGGTGKNIVFAGAGEQTIVLGPDDDILHGGGGNDTIGSAGGNDQIFGDEGNDTVFGGEGNDMVDGGRGVDTLLLTGSGRADYALRIQDGKTVFTHRNSGMDGVDTVANVELIRFSGTPPDLGADATLTRLYDAVFNRAPDASGKNSWLAANANGTSMHDIAANLVSSAEAQQLHGALSNVQYVDKLYNLALDRTADTAGRDYWSGMLDNGRLDRADVLLNFVNSSEKLASEHGVPIELDFNRSEVASLVRLYDSVLHRHPDQDGINYWIATNEGGIALRDIAACFVDSVEGRHLYGALNNAQYVEMLYRQVLQRDGSAQERAGWTAGLDNGSLQRGDVALAFADSAEKIALVGVIDTSIATL